MMSVSMFFGEKKFDFQTPMTSSRKKTTFKLMTHSRKKPQLDLNLKVLKTMITQN